MSNVDVLVVGAGPTGVVLACELLRRGISVRVVDQRAAPSTSTKAMVLQPRTLELLDDLGLADALIARGVKLRGVTVWAGNEVVATSGLEDLGSRYDFMLALPQTETEAILLEKLTSLGGSVERETKLVGLRQDGTGVTVTLQKGGSPSARAAWLVGCDGAHGTVRKELEIPFEGPSLEEHVLLADVKIAWDVRDDRISSWFTEDGMVACYPLKDGRWRVLATAPAGDTSDQPPTLEALATMFAARTGTGATLSDATWLARQRVHCRQAARHRDDRVFLAGDAVHVHGSAAAQGMNSGIQDAVNLAWKLALVHRGHARGLLLDTYESERRAVGAAIVRGADAAAKLGTYKNPVAKAVRTDVGRFLSGFEHVQQRIDGDVGGAATAYAPSEILREDRTSLLHARLGSAAGGETPTLGSVRDFDGGPRAGARAPDARVTIAGESGTKRLSQCLDGRYHGLLLFDGRSDSAEGYERFVEIERTVRERFGDIVRTHVVTPRASRPAALPDTVPVLLDPDGELEKRYAASTECLYLVRPDLHIAYRSQPAELDKLLAYLKSVFRPGTGSPS